MDNEEQYEPDGEEESPAERRARRQAEFDQIWEMEHAAAARAAYLFGFDHEMEDEEE